ncbi:MAG: DEAD/DEAH box helicase family protein [Clostridia bacterium]|nr:DEAD/DEAH box helicase family protein [Clostridia bacterium]
MNLIIDSIMGGGKTTWAINHMNRSQQRRFIFATPFLNEDIRIKNSCPTLHFVEPNGTFSKMSDLKKIISQGKNVATTHALLSQWIPTAADIDNLRKWNYTLILDEALEVIRPVQNLNADDLRVLRAGLLEVDAATNKVTWIAENCPQRYLDIKKLADAGRLFICRDSQLLDLMPIDVLKSTPNIIVMTFLFEASHLCYYMRMHGMRWRKAFITNGRIQMGEADLTPKKQEIKRLLSIYSGKYNHCGEKRNALSASFWTSARHAVERRQVIRNIRSFFLTYCRSSVDHCMWSTFKDKPGSETNVVKGFKTAFVPFNAKATNEFGDRTCLAYAVNVYENPMIFAWFCDHGLTLDCEVFALSAMLQWIWRSAIRNGRAVKLYLPSLRMREILCAWLES